MKEGTEEGEYEYSCKYIPLLMTRTIRGASGLRNPTGRRKVRRQDKHRTLITCFSFGVPFGRRSIDLNLSSGAR